MLQAKDIRIGNLVNWKGTPCLIEGIQRMADADVEPARTGYTVDLLHNGEIIQTPWVEDIEPIPITSEWLERMGFKDGGPHDGGEHSWRIPDFEFGYDGRSFYFYDGNNCVQVSDSSFVHQLQNLYHALTGEELTIK